MSESLIFAHFLFLGEWYEWIAHFAQIKWAMWENCSFRSPKMSDHEQFAQRKWAIMSKSLRSLTKNERMSESLIFLSKSHICSFLDKKRAIRSEIKWANSQPWKSMIKMTIARGFPWKSILNILMLMSFWITTFSRLCQFKSTSTILTALFL